MDDFAKVALDRIEADALHRGHVGNSSGSIQSAVLGQINAPQPAELRNAIERASQTHKNLADLHENLNRHLDRILGSRPEKDDERCGTAVGPDCEMNALRNVLSDLDDVAYRIRNQVERLARL